MLQTVWTGLEFRTSSTKITNKINDYLFNYLVELSLPYWISVRSNDECDRFKVIDSLKISLEMTDEKINLLNKIYSNKTFAILFFCKKYGTIKALRIIGYYLLKVK